LIVLPACAPSPLDHTFGDGSFTVGEDIAPGTYITANTGPHTEAVQCEWTVSKESNRGVVTLRSGETGDKVQQVYLAGGDVITTAHCGIWAWESSENLTR
jgi:hypothetical protein